MNSNQTSSFPADNPNALYCVVATIVAVCAFFASILFSTGSPVGAVLELAVAASLIGFVLYHRHKAGRAEPQTGP